MATMNGISEYDRKGIDSFFSAISPWESAYTHVGLSYLAVRKNGSLYLLQCRIFFHTAPSAIPHTQIDATNVLAGHFLLSELGKNSRELIEQLDSTGYLETPVGKLVFPKDSSGRISVYFDRFNHEAITAGNWLSVLKLCGERWQLFVAQPDTDWRLKANVPPFDSLNELLAEYSLAGYRDDSACIEVVATQIAAIDTNSTVNDNEGLLAINIAKSLDIAKCHIGYRALLHGKVEIRGSIKGNELSWTEQEHFRHGVGRVNIPQGAVLHCFACYDGFTHHQYWIADPKNFQNPRRAVLEEFHNGLDTLRKYLFDEQRRGKDARDFEFGVAWLMWMLGFNTSQVGGTANTAEAADIVAMTPYGNALIMECTTGLLKSDKVAKLVERSEIVKKRLSSSGNNHLKVLSVIVTSKPKDEVKADFEEVQNKGIAVITKEDLEAALSQTIMLSDAEVIFNKLLEITQKQNPFSMASGRTTVFGS